eukprot:2575683-Pyramimonas_sp.AAC.1
MFGLSWGSSRSTWSVLEAPWAARRPSEAFSGPSGGCLGPHWASLEQSGHRLAVVLGRPEPLLRLCWVPRGPPGMPQEPSWGRRG